MVRFGHETRVERTADAAHTFRNEGVKRNIPSGGEAGPLWLFLYKEETLHSVVCGGYRQTQTEGRLDPPHILAEDGWVIKEINE